MKIKNINEFLAGIILLILSLIVGYLRVGWITEDYGITISFFGLFYSISFLICPNIVEEGSNE